MSLWRLIVIGLVVVFVGFGAPAIALSGGTVVRSVGEIGTGLFVLLLLDAFLVGVPWLLARRPFHDYARAEMEAADPSAIYQDLGGDAVAPSVQLRANVASADAQRGNDPVDAESRESDANDAQRL